MPNSGASKCKKGRSPGSPCHINSLPSHFLTREISSALFVRNAALTYLGKTNDTPPASRQPTDRMSICSPAKASEAAYQIPAKKTKNRAIDSYDTRGLILITAYAPTLPLNTPREDPFLQIYPPDPAPCPGSWSGHPDS